MWKLAARAAAGSETFGKRVGPFSTCDRIDRMIDGRLLFVCVAKTYSTYIALQFFQQGRLQHGLHLNFALLHRRLCIARVRCELVTHPSSIRPISA